jgi:hypothetical protein
MRSGNAKCLQYIFLSINILIMIDFNKIECTGVVNMMIGYNGTMNKINGIVMSK